jgi:hypothetical protein
MPSRVLADTCLVTAANGPFRFLRRATVVSRELHADAMAAVAVRSNI